MRTPRQVIQGTPCCDPLEPSRASNPPKVVIQKACIPGRSLPDMYESFGDRESTSMQEGESMKQAPPSMLAVPSRPVMMSDLKGAIIVFRNESAAHALRQEKMFVELSEQQSTYHNECVSNSSRQEQIYTDLLTGQGTCREEMVVLRQFQQELMTEVRSLSTTLSTMLADGSGSLCPRTVGIGESKEGAGLAAHLSPYVGQDTDLQDRPLPDSASKNYVGVTQNELTVQTHVHCGAQDQVPRYARDPRYAGEPGSPGTQQSVWDSRGTPETLESLESQKSDSSKKVQKAASKLNFGTGDDDEDQGEQSGSLRSRVSRTLRRKEFEFAIATAICCNAFIMFWEGQYHGLHVGEQLQFPGRLKPHTEVWPGAQIAFDILDWSFGLVFLTECGAKLACWRAAYFRSAWNVLDFTCVTTFMFDKLFAGSMGFNPQMLRLLRLFRLVRLVRLLRFMESLDHLYVMATAIAGLAKVLTWACVLLTVMLVACDLFLVQLLQATYFSGVKASDLTEEALEKHHQIYRYFGTCTRCILSMFEITLGNWPPVARLLTEEVSEWFTLLCLVHKLTIGFAVIGVITGVILQETFKVAQTDDLIMLRQRKRAAATLRGKLEDLFNRLDDDGSGVLDKDEFMQICQDANMKTWLASLDIETDDVATLFELCDDDGNNKLTVDEVCAKMPRIRGTARSIDVLKVMNMQRTMVKDNRSYEHQPVDKSVEGA